MAAAVMSARRAPDLERRQHNSARAHSYGSSGPRQVLGGSARSHSSGPREAQSVRQRTGGSGQRGWQGMGSFYVQVERCSGAGKECASVRHDEEKYQKYSKMVNDIVEQYFDGQIPVEQLSVPTLYAMEVRVMPGELHPSNRPALVGKEAEAAGAFTVFSKIESKKWPARDAIIRTLQDFCRVPVRITMLGRELRASTGPEATEAHRAVNQDPVGVESLAALRRIEFNCANDRGMNFELHTGGDGKAEIPLFPGVFRLSFTEGSGYDKLTPSSLTVPADFSLLDITITASMKKKCTFYIVDHLGKAFGSFPLRLVHQDPRVAPLSLRSKVDGKCRARLGRGVYLASYDGGSTNPANWPIEPLSMELEVHDTDIPQSFRINVVRTRFTCEIMLRTRFEEPAAHCPFKVKDFRGHPMFSGVSTDIGIAVCDLPTGHYTLQVTPVEDSPFVQSSAELHVKDDGSYEPLEKKVQTKTTDVQINLVTPDGEPAPDCTFHLEPQFQQSGAMARAREMKVHANEAGIAVATMSLLEPYIFKVKPSGKASEYMSQHFVFQTSRREVTIVVARSVFGQITEERIALVIDTSGSMQVYLDDIKIALNTVLTEQLFRSTKQFNIVTFSAKSLAFRPDLVDCRRENLEDAMRFCDAIEAGGGSELGKSMEHAFQFPNLEAMYIVTDGKTEMKDQFLNQVRAMYFSHPKRPKLHTIGINCVPRRLTWQGLQAIALLTQGVFRPTCLEQAILDTAPMPPGGGAPSMQWSSLDLAPATSGFAGTDEEYAGYSEDAYDEYDTA